MDERETPFVFFFKYFKRLYKGKEYSNKRIV